MYTVSIMGQIQYMAMNLLVVHSPNIQGKCLSHRPNLRCVSIIRSEDIQLFWVNEADYVLQEILFIQEP